MARLATLPRVPDVHDSFLFVMGVERFSIAEGRPHWPGYPVYIWLGKAMDAVVGDPVLALHLVSVAASALVAWPLAIVARAWARQRGAASSRADAAGWAAAALWLATPMAWVTGSQILSDPAGLLCGAGVLALAVSGEDGRPERWLAAAALGGLMPGVRLVNVTLLSPLAWKAWRVRRERWRHLAAPAALALAFGAGLLPWALWLAAREPQILGPAARNHVAGHFHLWGESVLTDREPAFRPGRALRTFVVYGIGGGTPRVGLARAAAVAAWLAALALAARRGWGWTSAARLLALWAGPNLAYVFLAHDVAYPRYAMTAVAVASVGAGLAVLTARPYGIATVAVALAASLAISAPIAHHQREQPPVEDRTARFLAKQPEAAVVIVEASDLASDFAHLAPSVRYVAVPDAAAIPRWSVPWAAEGRRVFATAVPPDDPSGWIPVAHFCRDPFIDPRLSPEMWLFSPVAQANGPPVVGCVDGG